MSATDRDSCYTLSCLVLDPCRCQIRGQVPQGPHYWNSKCQRVQVIKRISSLPKETNHLVGVTSSIIGVSTEYTHTYCFLYHICLNCVSISSLACITQRDSSSLWFWYNTDITGINTLYPNSLIINKCASDILHYGVQLEIALALNVNKSMIKIHLWKTLSPFHKSDKAIHCSRYVSFNIGTQELWRTR